MLKIAYILDHKGDFRFKTEREFKEEYGPNWRNAILATWPNPMDALFGVDLNTCTTRANSTLDFWLDYNGRQWRINEEMLVEESLLRTVDISIRNTVGRDSSADISSLTGYCDYSSILK